MMVYLVDIPKLEEPSYRAVVAALHAWAAANADAIEKRWPLTANRLMVHAHQSAIRQLPPSVTSQTYPVKPVRGLLADMGTTTYLHRGQPIDGSLHFAPGTALYVHPPFSGDGFERTFMVGSDRTTRRYKKIMGPTHRLVDWRVEKIAQPPMLYAIEQGFPPWHDWLQRRPDALPLEAWAAEMNARVARRQ